MVLVEVIFRCISEKYDANFIIFVLLLSEMMCITCISHHISSVLSPYLVNLVIFDIILILLIF